MGQHRSPPSRVTPLPPPGLLTQFVTLAHAERTPTSLAASEILTIGFFFLLRPGAYLSLPDPAPDNLFRLRDIRLYAGRLPSSLAPRLPVCRPPLCHVRYANVHASEKWSMERNRGTRPIWPSPHLPRPLSCFPRGLFASVSRPTGHTHQRLPRGPSQFPAVRPGTRSNASPPCCPTLALYPDPANLPHEFSARSTRPGGAMTLLCAGIGADRIRMVGRWRSNELYRYLHVQAQQVMTGLRGGQFNLAPR